MADDQNSITVLVADDHPVTRAGIRAILNQAADVKVVGEAENGTEAERLVAELRPQILLLDLKMPGPSPAEIEKWVRTHYPETITLVLTAHERDAYLASMIDAGAAGFLSKNESNDRLIDAIRRAARGEFLFDAAQLAKAGRWREDAGKRWDSLTAREREILRLLAKGLNNAAIAETLTISEKTAAFHVTHVFSKLGVKSRHEAIAWVHTCWPDDLDEIRG